VEAVPGEWDRLPGLMELLTQVEVEEVVDLRVALIILVVQVDPV
jgi:hypothetical protein